MSRTLDLPTSHHRRMPLVGAVVVVLAGLVFLAGVPLTASTPAPANDGLQRSILACKLRVIRQAPVLAPANDVFGDIAASPAAAGYRITGAVTATDPTGASVTFPWVCATEQHGADWRVWSVQVGH